MNAPAYEHNGKPCTRERLYAIACDPRRNVAVEACAGSGKTWMLVSRIVRALLDGARPQEILAITFTRKAAGEMRQRLHEWLADFARPRPDESDDAWRARLTGELVVRGVSQTQAGRRSMRSDSSTGGCWRTACRCRSAPSTAGLPRCWALHR